MATKKGIVEKTENGFAWVKAARKSACGTCASKSSCGFIDGGSQMLVKTTNTIGATKGDSVEFHMASELSLKCMFIIYIIPVLGLLIGALSAAPLADFLGLNATIGMVVFTLLFFVLAVGLSKNMISRIVSTDEFLPNIKRVFPPVKPVRS
jgi:sigma-E factor negative regulatory protein RseC